MSVAIAQVLGPALDGRSKERPELTMLPIPLAAMLCMGFGCGLALGTLNVFFRDVGELTSIGLQILMWTAPIVYVADVLPAWAGTLMLWHPIMPALEAIRGLFLYNRLPEAGTWVRMAVWAGVWMLTGHLIIKALKSEIRDLV